MCHVPSQSCLACVWCPAQTPRCCWHDGHRGQGTSHEQLPGAEAHEAGGSQRNTDVRVCACVLRESGHHHLCYPSSKGEGVDKT